jgi:hypothetical protein
MAVSKPMLGRQPGGVLRKPCQRRPAAYVGRYNTSRLMNLGRANPDKDHVEIRHYPQGS